MKKYKNLPALSIKQPYLQWIMEHKKIYEIRSWKTNYRGDIILCSSKMPASPCDYLKGYALCIAELTDIQPMCAQHVKKSCVQLKPNHYAWALNNVRPIRPFPVKGKLHLFKIDF